MPLACHKVHMLSKLDVGSARLVFKHSQDGAAGHMVQQCMLALTELLETQQQPSMHSTLKQDTVHKWLRQKQHKQ